MSDFWVAFFTYGLPVWLYCPGQPDEDTITINLVNLLSKDTVVRRICYFVAYQHEPFGIHSNGASYSKGKIDIAIMVDQERERYVAYECKRLNVISKAGRSSLAARYVTEGMMRFMTEQYAEALPLGCMLGYVMDGHLPFALTQVHAAILTNKTTLSLTAGPYTGQAIRGCERFSTDHQRATKARIEIRHVLLPFGAAKSSPTAGSSTSIVI
jgi:hypothetical protein